jgi:hypothetical protein
MQPRSVASWFHVNAVAMEQWNIQLENVEKVRMATVKSPRP